MHTAMIERSTGTTTALREILDSHSRWVDTGQEWASRLSAFQRNAAEYIAHRVVLTAVPKGAAKIGVMLSGGEDSSFLLDVVKRHRPEAEIRAFSAATRGNSADIARATTLCGRLGVQLRVLQPPHQELEYLEAEFSRRFGRPSRDPAQPIHNYVSLYVASDFPGALVIDGQFCDTVLHSNPHNTLLMAYGRIGPTRPVIPILKEIFSRSGASRRTQRLRTALELLEARSVEEYVLRACQVPDTDENMTVAKCLTSRFGAQTALTALFFWVTTKRREREKYLLPQLRYVIPFDSEELFWLSSYSFSRLVNMFIRKIPIHTYLVDRYPDLFRKQRTLPFEPV